MATRTDTTQGQVEILRSSTEVVSNKQGSSLSFYNMAAAKCLVPVWLLVPVSAQWWPVCEVRCVFQRRARVCSSATRSTPSVCATSAASAASATPRARTRTGAACTRVVTLLLTRDTWQLLHLGGGAGGGAAGGRHDLHHGLAHHPLRHHLHRGQQQAGSRQHARHLHRRAQRFTTAHCYQFILYLKDINPPCL